MSPTENIPGDQTLIVVMLLRDQGTTGVQTHVRAFREWLAAQGRPAKLVTPFDAPAASRLALYGLIALRRVLERVAPPLAVDLYRTGHGWCLRQALRRHLSGHSKIVIYAQCPVSAAAALRLAPDRQASVVMAVHYNESQADEWADKGAFARNSHPHRRIRDFEAKWLPQLHGLVFVSRFMRDRICAQHPACAALEHAVIPNFVSPPSAAAAGPAAELLSIGTLEPRKNQRYLLDIIAAARDQGQTLSLTIVGDGPDRKALAGRARELGIEAQVHFAGFRRDAASLIHRHRALVHVARIENLPLVVLEAYACSRPVFAVPAGGIAEVLADGVEGRHLPATDPSTAARIIRATLDNPEELTAMGSSALARHLQSFSTEVVAARLEAFILGAGPRRRSPVPAPRAASPGSLPSP